MTAAAQSTGTADTAQNIFTAALIAEDIAITMYYNALIGGVIQDPNLAGSGGTATSITAGGSAANVGYLRGALAEEVSHAALLRSVLNISAATSDPVQTFYFPTGTFDTLANFFPILIALETAFIGAYMKAVQEFSLMIGNVSPYSSSQISATGTAYTSTQLAFFAKISAAILGVEAEQRTGTGHSASADVQWRPCSSFRQRLLRIHRQPAGGLRWHELRRSRSEAVSGTGKRYDSLSVPNRPHQRGKRSTGLHGNATYVAFQATKGRSGESAAFRAPVGQREAYSR